MIILGVEIKDGCSNAGCYIRKPIGQHTNGMCNCIPRNIPTLKKIEIMKELMKIRGNK